MRRKRGGDSQDEGRPTPSVQALRARRADPAIKGEKEKETPDGYQDGRRTTPEGRYPGRQDG